MLFDPDLALKQFDSELEIIKTFFPIRLSYYHKRKVWLCNKLEAEAKKLQNQARFILEKLAGDLPIENKKKSLIVSMLISKKFDSDPVKKWQSSIGDSVSDCVQLLGYRRLQRDIEIILNNLVLLSSGLYQLILSWQKQLIFLNELNELVTAKMIELNELVKEI